ncbi:MAG TPA: YhjD/YihY/BrkB family envelope integrity protein, partial [Chloroflexota bacterium]|nr:YhjD/YihY/BrkB family envelope integrity protein [Chloroflexota bacterium]
MLTHTKQRLERYAAYRVLTTVADGYQKDKVMENAAAMTYFGVFSIFPTLLIFMSVTGLVLQNNETAKSQVLGLVTNFLPVGQARLHELIQDVIEARGVAAGIGSLTLIWSALGFFQVIDGNVNEIWGVSKPRSFIKSKLFALTMVGALGIVALASFVATAAVQLLAEIMGAIPGSVLFWQLVVSSLTFLTIAAVFYLLYRYTP